MKKLIYTLLYGYIILLTGCSSFTDVQPKGTNLLTTVDQLDMLFNYAYNDKGLSAYDDEYFIGDIYPSLTNIPNLISQTSPSLMKILVTWDESQDRTQYTPSDDKYTIYYYIIGKIANPVLAKIDVAEGDTLKAKQLKAEALVLRAYFEYLAVNHYAKAYNSTSAATDGGVPYPMENESMSEPCKKYSIQQVYDLINADLDAAIELNSLPDKNVNQMRVNRAFAYAVRAEVYMSMKEYDKAMEAAQQSLAINNTIANYNTMLLNTRSSYTKKYYKLLKRMYLECNEDLFYTYYRYVYIPFTPEFCSLFEKGNIVYNCYPCDSRTYGYNLHGPTYYGLDIDCSTMASKTFFSNSGLTTIDMYLIISEVDIRKGNIDDAMGVLDKLRVCRVLPENYAPLKGSITTKADAIYKFKQISRTENLWTIKNFINLKRWNTEDNEWATTLKKTILGKEYILRPNSPLWIWAFPSNATGMNENLTQNY